MFWVYAIYNTKHNKIYIGETKSISRRLSWHNNKIFTNSYTSRFDGEWILIYKEMCEDRSQARVREKQLKSYRGRQFIKKFIPR